MSLERLRIALADRYRLERELGQGGMATVYLAHDLRHERDVAIKVLHPDLGAALGPERFLAEIRTTARLQHPHILPLLDSGVADGRSSMVDGPDASAIDHRPSTSALYYVMPYVAGETLRARLERERQLPVDDAVRIAREVADALHYAHGHGVIHRDIKPENILLQDGHALVADFGIALAVQQAGGARMTQTGLSLGTPQYMSPEQAMGERTIDARSDIYALAAVTYEMLVGEPPFTGPSVQAIVAKVMTERPTPLHTVRDTVPDHVEDAVLRALAKLPADRFASAAEFTSAVGSGTTTATRASDARRSSARGAAAHPRWRTVSAALGLTTLGAVALAAWGLSRRPSNAGPSIYDVATPDSARISFINTSARMATYGAVNRGLGIAPDGSFVVYAALQPDSSTILWYRSLRTDETRPLQGTAGGSTPRVSPDGSQVAYFDKDQVMVVPLDGGDPRRIAPVADGSILGWLSPTEVLAIGADGERAHWINPGGGEPRALSIPRCPLGTWAASIGEMLCSFASEAQLINLETRTTASIRSTMGDGSPGNPLAGSDFRLVDDRYIVFVNPDGVLSAARFDPERRVVGSPVALVSGVRREALGQAQFDLSPSGTLVYAPGIDATVGRLVRRRPAAQPEQLPIEAANFQRYNLSRDGRWVAATVQGSGLNELRIYDLRTGQRTVWQRAENIRHPVWSPDGETMLFGARAANTWSLLRGLPGSGTSVDTLATYAAGGSLFDPIAYVDDTLAIAQDWSGATVALFNPRAETAVMDTLLTRARFPSVSPTATLVVYQTQDDSRIMVTTFPEPTRQWQIASQGVEPLWLSPSTVLYRNGAEWYTANVNPTTGEPSGAPVRWAADPRFSDTSGWSNALSYDGGIIYVQGPEQTSPGYFRVIPNWVTTMRRAVDGGEQ